MSETGDGAMMPDDRAAGRSTTSALLAEAMVLARDLRRVMLAMPDVSPTAPLLHLQRAALQGELVALLGHAVAWLLARRAVETGELTPDEGRAPARRLGAAPAVAVDPAALGGDLAQLDGQVRALHARLARLDRLLDRPA